VKLRFPKRTPRPVDGRMSIVDHLAEFRRRFIICIVAVVICGVICFVLSPRIIGFLIPFYQDAVKDPHKKLVFLGPLDAFATRLKIATYGGIVLALPVWLFQLWRFITPGLNPKERRYAIPFVLSSIVLFIFGGIVALFTLQPALSFLLGIGGPNLRPELTADKYLGLVSLMIVAFGAAFEFPVVLVFLLLARILSTAQLKKWRRWAIVGIFIFAAVITPSQDPYSLFAMAVPMCLFYEATILIGRVIKR
jgi:sec-independent protein translocase protein TatC